MSENASENAYIGMRGDRAPPRKPPSTLFPAFPRKAILTRIADPAEGRAPHARKEGFGLTRGMSPWANRPRPAIS